MTGYISHSKYLTMQCFSTCVFDILFHSYNLTTLSPIFVSDIGPCYVPQHMMVSIFSTKNGFDVIWKCHVLVLAKDKANSKRSGRAFSFVPVKQSLVFNLCSCIWQNDRFTRCEIYYQTGMLLACVKLKERSDK